MKINPMQKVSNPINPNQCMTLNSKLQGKENVMIKRTEYQIKNNVLE